MSSWLNYTQDLCVPLLSSVWTTKTIHKTHAWHVIRNEKKTANKTCSLAHTTLTERNPWQMCHVSYSQSNTTHVKYINVHSVCVCMCVCVQAHNENTPDVLHNTFSSCRDWLLLKLDKHDRMKLLLHPTRSTFFRCCAAKKLDDTLHQSSVVGYKCKTIQWLVLSQQVETPAYGQALLSSLVLVLYPVPIFNANTCSEGERACIISQTHSSTLHYPNAQVDFTGMTL